jgi:hypothetical protein
MLRSGRFADQPVVEHRALQQPLIDEFIVDAVTNRLFNVGECVVLVFHHSIISRGWGLQPLRPPAGAVVHAHDLDRGSGLAKVSNSLRDDFVWLESAQAFANQQALQQLRKRNVSGSLTFTCQGVE